MVRKIHRNVYKVVAVSSGLVPDLKGIKGKQYVTEFWKITHMGAFDI